MDAPIEKKNVLLQYSGFYPAGELKPKACQALQGILIGESHFFIEKAWLQGGGIDLEWATLWEYRSIHAQAVMAWCEENMELKMQAPILSITKGDQIMLHIAASAMLIADFPLLIQDIICYQFEKQHLNVKSF